jgi:hypothetical protein
VVDTPQNATVYGSGTSRRERGIYALLSEGRTRE